MNDKEQIEAFVKEVTCVVNRFKSEFNLKIAAAIGVLELIKLDLYHELKAGLEDDTPPYLGDSNDE